MSSNPFAKRWDHTLRIRDILESAEPLPSAEETIGYGKAVTERIRKLQKTLREDDPLWHDMDNCVEAFEELDGIENAYEARDRFNAALSGLYDEADAGKRVWIE